MKTTTTLLISGLSLGLSLLVQAEVAGGNTNAVEITPALINACLEEARTNSPVLRAADARTKAAVSDVAAVRFWEDPEFVFGDIVSADHEAQQEGFLYLGGSSTPTPISGETRTRVSEHMGDLIYGLNQPVPLFGKPILAKRVAKATLAKERQNTDYLFQSLRRDLVSQLIKTAWAEGTVELRRQDIAWLDTMTGAMEQKYRNSLASQPEVLQLQNQKAKRIDQIQTDQNKVAMERLTLNRLLGRDLQSPWPRLALPILVPPLKFSPRLIDQALLNEPKLKVMHAEVQRAQAVTRLTRRQKFPEVGLGVAGRQYSGDGEFVEGLFSVSLTVPLLNLTKYHSDLKRDQERLRAADYELAVRDAVQNLILQIDAARREALLYRQEIIPQDRQALASAQAAWEVNRGPFREVMEAHRSLLEDQWNVTRAIAQ